MPTTGTRYSTAAEAAKATGLDVPDCEGAEYYNAPVPGQLYGHPRSEEIALIVHPVAMSPVRAGRKLETVESKNLIVHGLPAVGYEYNGDGGPTPVGTDEMAFPPDRKTYIDWNEGRSYIQMATDVMTLRDFLSYVERCRIASGV